MKTYFNAIDDNTALLMILKKGGLEYLLNQAKEEGEKHEWLQAADLHQKAADLALKDNDLTKAATIAHRVGFCFYRAAYQAQTNVEFRKRLKRVIEAYEKEVGFLEEVEEKSRQVRIKQARALAVYAESCLRKSVSEKKQLLDEWWTLENQVLKAYENLGDVHSVGVVCADMIEFSLVDRIFLSDPSERDIMLKNLLNLAEKAITSLTNSGDEYELARTYCVVSICFDHIADESPEFQDRLSQLHQKGHEYSKKALELSLKIGNAWLIGFAYRSSMTAAVYCNHDWPLVIEYGKESQKFSKIAKDKLLLSKIMLRTASATYLVAEFTEDPDKQRASFKQSMKLTRESRNLSQIINNIPDISSNYVVEIISLNGLSAIETDFENRQNILQNAIKIARESVEVTKGWKGHAGTLYLSLSDSLRLLSGTKSGVEEKKAALLEAESLGKKANAINDKYYRHSSGLHSLGNYNLGLTQIELARIETGKSKKATLLRQVVNTLQRSNELLEIGLRFRSDGVAANQLLGKHNDRLGRVLKQLYSLTKEKEQLSRAIEVYQKASVAFTKGEMPAHAAESYWYIAQLEGFAGNNQEASKDYESASEAYLKAAKKIPQLEEFYQNYSNYMLAWSQIEKAKHAHSIEAYEESKIHYEKAAEIHETSESWSYLAPNYLAWGSMEEAENLSRSENTQQAKETFQKALEAFIRAEKSIKEKIEEITSPEEKDRNQRLLDGSDLRRSFCQARIKIEEAKLLDKKGKYLQSSEKYREAAQEIKLIIEKVEAEAERKELELLAVLCQAWEKMAEAEETTSSDSYLEAAHLFEQAKEHCYTRKASLWALGNSNFCRGLAAGLQYKTTLDLADHAKAKGYVKNASTDYLQAGFDSAAEYAKATQRLFDAYVFINQAEGEIDQEKRAKQYQMAENMLQMAAGSFMKAKQPEKTAQVQQLLKTAREEKAIAVSLGEVLHAPTITSSTMSFTAPSPTSEASVGLEQFQHANVQANLIAGLREVKVGESFCLTVEFVNAGREPALLTRVEDFVPPDFIVVRKPEIYRIEESCLNMKGKQLAPLKLVEAKLVLQPSKKGVYQLKPVVYYLDELGQNKSLQLKSVEIKVAEVILSDRISTGTRELDSLLLGGIPKEYAVVLTGSPSDEREALIRNFLEAGIGESQASFYVATEAVGIEGILKKSGFYLFLCNPKPKAEVPDLPNVHKLLGKTDLTNLNIALLKAYRSVGQSSNKRVCLEIVSDVLLRYGAEATRRWISELTTDMVSKGFTILAVMNPAMHPPDQATAVVDLFDGEISLYQTEDPLECKKSLRIKKLRNQDYIKNPICLT